MKKIGMLACCFLLMGGMAFAQKSENAKDAPMKKRVSYSPETIAMMRVDRLMQIVELTPQEKDAVYALFQKEEKEALARREAAKAEREKRIETMKACREKSNADLKKIIGEEKFAKYEASKADDGKNRELRRPCDPQQQCLKKGQR